MADSEVHIIPGPSAGGCLQTGRAFRQTWYASITISCRVGHYRRSDHLDDWRDVRQGYLRSLDREDPTFAFGDQHRDLLSNLERLRAAQTITLWIGTGLAEQLLLVWTVAVLRRLGVEHGRVSKPSSSVRIAATKSSASASSNPSQFKEHPGPTQRRR